MAARTVTNVVVAGAFGNLGPGVVRGLVDAGFMVTVLSRSASPASVKDKFGDACAVVTADYHDHLSLVSALGGQDAVVSCGVGMLPEQTLLIDAAVDAGVFRYIPADFAMDLRYPFNRALHINKDKVATEDHLRSKQARISYTSVHTGPLIDYCLGIGALINLKKRTQNRYDDGDMRFSTTTTTTAGKAVAAVLLLAPKTANRVYHIQDCVTTQNQLLRLAKELTPGQEWTITHASTDEMAAKADEQFDADPKSREGLILQRGSAMFGRHSSHAGIEDNCALGVPPALSDEASLKALLQSYL